MKGSILLLASVLAFVLPGELVAALPQWQSAGDWSVGLGKVCFAARSYRLKSNELQLALEPNPTTGGVMIYFTTKGTISEFDHEKARLTLGSGQPASHALAVMPSAQPRRVIYELGLRADQFRELMRTPRLQLSSPEFDADLQLGDLQSAAPQLDECESRWMAGWGFDKTQQSRLANFPVPQNLGDLNRSDYYPNSAADRRAIGVIRAYVMVGPDGRAISCQVLESSGHPDLDTRTCQVWLAKSRFKPAMSNDGKAMTAPYLFQMMWDILY